MIIMIDGGWLIVVFGVWNKIGLKMLLMSRIERKKIL
jgi:hypothetical protein